MRRHLQVGNNARPTDLINVQGQEQYCKENDPVLVSDGRELLNITETERCPYHLGINVRLPAI